MLLSGPVPGDPHNAGSGSDPAPYTWQATARTARLYLIQWRQGTTILFKLSNLLVIIEDEVLTMILNASCTNNAFC